MRTLARDAWQHVFKLVEQLFAQGHSCEHILGEAYPSMVHSRQDCDTIAFAMPLRGSGCMPQTSRGCAMTGSSDSARVYWGFPKNATNEGESAMHMHGNLIKRLSGNPPATSCLYQAAFLR